MELDSPESIETKNCLYNRFTVSNHTRGERTAHCRAKELGVGQHTSTHLNKSKIKQKTMECMSSRSSF